MTAVAVFLDLLTISCLLVAIALAARAAYRLPAGAVWRAAAVFLALLGAAKLLLSNRAWEGVVEALLAFAVLASVALLQRGTIQLHDSRASLARLDERLVKSERRYKLLLQTLPEAVVVLEDERIIFVNRAFSKIFGVEAAAAQGMRLEEFVAPNWREAFSRRHSEEPTTPHVGTRRLEVKVFGKEGRLIWVEMRLATSVWEDRPSEVVLISDISERHQAEQRLQRITQTMLELSGEYDASVRRLTEVCGELLGASSAAYQRLQGETLATVAGWQLPAGYPDVDSAAGRLGFAVIQKRQGNEPLIVAGLGQTSYAESDPNVRRFALSTFAGFPVTSRGRTVGSLCVMYRHPVALSPAEGQVLQALASALGVEEDRQYARQLQQAARRIAEAAQYAEDLPALGVVVHTEISRFFKAVGFFLAILDRSSQVLSFAYFAPQHETLPSPPPGGRDLVELVLRSGQALVVSPKVLADLRAKGELGEELPWADGLLVPLVDPEGAFGVIGVYSDREEEVSGQFGVEVLTSLAGQVAGAVQHLRSEEQLKQSELKYRTLVDRMQDGVFLLQGSRLVFCNQALARMLGRSQSELEGSEFIGLVDPRDRELVLERYRRRQAGESVPEEYEFRLRHANGRLVEVLMRVGLVEYQGRLATMGTLRDLTERRRLEAQLRQAQRIEALGQLAGGVAHDFNNLLMAIQGSAQLLQQRLGEGPREELETILATSRRAAQLTRGLLAFAQRQVLQPQPLDLSHHIEQTLPILRRMIPENIDIEFLPSAVPLVVEVDAGQLDQILMNLAVNSRDAMESGGDIVITTAAAALGSAYCQTHPWAKPGNYAHLQVRDTGVGMDGGILAHVFEPFFTTKAVGRGTGLGLSTVYGIVKQHGGMIDVTSEVGVGTTIDVYFPTVDKPPVGQILQAEGELLGGSECILVVEDEPEVRHIIVEALREAGYQVVDAGDGAAALDVLLNAGKEVDLVLSDVVMPRMGGKELLGAVRAHGLRVPFLFSSGYGEAFIAQHRVPGNSVAFLAKPYTIADLLRKVREVLTFNGPPEV